MELNCNLTKSIYENSGGKKHIPLTTNLSRHLRVQKRNETIIKYTNMVSASAARLHFYNCVRYSSSPSHSGRVRVCVCIHLSTISANQRLIPNGICTILCVITTHTCHMPHATYHMKKWNGHDAQQWKCNANVSINCGKSLNSKNTILGARHIGGCRHSRL